MPDAESGERFYTAAFARDAPYGRIAMLADPFGHGFCLLQFSARGYDALLEG